MEAILNNDDFDNGSGSIGADGTPDFLREDFVYLGDLANMPYGNYSAENRTDFLEELSVKDAAFLLNDYYHKSPESPERARKSPVKVVVIACNTATAYGKTAIEQMVDHIGLDVDVIGVVNAGARGSLATLGKTESGTIGVMATVGTVASEGYPKAVREALANNGYSGHVDIVQQGGIGISEAIDNDPDYLDRNIQGNSIRSRYAGPSLTNEKHLINRELLGLYNFSTDGTELLTDPPGAPLTADLKDIQINSIRNYVRFHVTELVVKMTEQGTAQPLRSIILGCTHYPYVENEINEQLGFLADFADESGNKPYAELLSGNAVLVDPAILTAREAYEALAKRNALQKEGDSNSEFYISVPNLTLEGVRANNERRFEYDYKYGRLPFYKEKEKDSPPEYVLRIPMIWNMLDNAVIGQIQERLPATYKAMEAFNGRKQDN